jgi:hypothetical protein
MEDDFAMTNEQEWTEELDALIAAPRHHALLFENEFVRVLDTRVAPGETVPAHTHRWPGALYFLSWSDCVRRDAEGTVVMDSRSVLASPEGDASLEGKAMWSGPLALHTLENVGDKELRAICVEVKCTMQAANSETGFVIHLRRR